MKWVHALKKIGVTVAKQQEKETVTTLLLRVDVARAELWKETMEALLISATTDTRDWSADVSKFYFVDGGVLKYLWRIVVRGNTENGLDMFGRCALNVLQAHAPEVTSFPLSEGSTTSSTPAPAK